MSQIINQSASQEVNRSRLFIASCVALIATAMTFAIRANIIPVLGERFQLSKEEIGLCVGTAFWGFTLAMIFGGFLVDALGMKALIVIAFIGHLAGVGLTIVATGFWSLFVSTLLVGIANGMVEAACNPLIASMYPENKTTMLNRFHLWFPGGIVIGGLVGYFIETNLMLTWEWQMASILIPTLAYGFLFVGQKFIETERVTSGVTYADMMQACAQPLFLLMVVAMLMTAATELGTGQWINTLLAQQIEKPILILVFINGIMAVGRGFAGEFVHRLSPAGMLLFSAIFSGLGLVLLGNGMTWTGALVFAIGICYFWPTMLGFVSDYLPKTGALGLSIMGGAGMLSVSIVLPFIGSFYDENKKAALEAAKTATETDYSKVVAAADLIAGKATLLNVAVLPAVLTVIFTFVYLQVRKQKVSH